MDKLPKICFNCPLSVSNKNPYCKTIGNKATGKLIVLPNLQKRDKGSIYNNKGYEIISNIYKDLFNKDILDDYAITCLVRCAPYEDYVRKEEINRCYTFLYRGVYINRAFNRIIMLGNVGCNIIGKSPVKDLISYQHNYIYYFLNYNPFSIMYNISDIFKHNMIRYFEAIEYNDLTGIKLINL
jgi:hypothetical protein